MNSVISNIEQYFCMNSLIRFFFYEIYSQISILKMDVEHSEWQVFAQLLQSPSNILERITQIALEVSPEYKTIETKTELNSSINIRH